MKDSTSRSKRKTYITFECTPRWRYKDGEMVFDGWASMIPIELEVPK